MSFARAGTRRWGLRLLRAVFATLVMLAVATAGPTSGARADGDPASDVLATQAMFLPQDASIPTAAAVQLAALLQEARRGGHPIRVAVIASPSDLGSVSELWRRPQAYAEFLGQELSLTYGGPLVVVMPGGVGLYHVAAGHLPVLGAGGSLDARTLAAVQAVSAAAGDRLALPARSAASAPAGHYSLPWIVFAIGAVLVAAAWTASFRARPPRLPGRRSSPG